MNTASDIPGLKTYIESKKLGSLAESLPLATPYTIGIDPTNLCNFKCTFCPTGHKALLKSIGRPAGVMDYGLFTSIIDGIKGFPSKIKRLYLYHEGEPLVNKQLPKMLAYAKQSDIAEMVQTTTNAALLTPDVAEKLLDADFDLIRISIEHVDDVGYLKLTKTKTAYETVRRNVEYLFEARERRQSKLQIHPKIMDTGLTRSQIEKFRNDFGPISDLLNIQYLSDMPGAAGIDFSLGTNPNRGSGGSPLRPERIVCPHPFYIMVVKWRGEVVTCSEEWRWENIVGDTKTQTLPEIWNGEKLRNFRMTHLLGERHKIPHCAGCPSIKGFPLENDLDQSRHHLIEHYK